MSTDGQKFSLKPVVFIFDRVMHYHVQLFKRLEQELPLHGYRLVLLSGKEKATTIGRVALREKIVADQREFELSEWHIRGFMVRYQSGIIDLLNQIRPSVVVSLCHSGTLSEWRIIQCKRRLGFRLVAWQCGYEYNPGFIKRFVLSRFVPRFDHHLAYHSNAGSYALAHGAPKDAVTVMFNTINEALIEKQDKVLARRTLEERFPMLSGRKIVLYVGAVLEEKRLDLVFEALDQLAREDVIFLLVGDGPYLSVLKQHYGERKDFVAAGRVVEGVGEYFDAADVFVLPGTGGLAINEAMAHGLPVVSGYADGSADDLVLDDKTGYRLRDGTAQELTKHLRRLFDNPDVAAVMGREGEQRIRGDLSFERFIARVTSVLTMQC